MNDSIKHFNTHRPAASALWEYIQERISDNEFQNLSDFKSNSINFKLAPLWNPRKNGVRYLKALIFHVIDSISRKNWERLVRIRNRNVGDPITVTYNGEAVCLDYLQAVYELEVISKNVSVDESKVLEIGAGYGRTCHTLFSNHDVQHYTIVDLPSCLALSQKYLEKVLTKEQFSKIDFVLAQDTRMLCDSDFDLCININSFAEMTARDTRYYLDFINLHGTDFYVKNPVGKYLDKSLDNHFQGRDIVDLALSTGLLRDIIDIHDNQAVKMQSKKFIRVYQPGDGWKCVSDSRATPWSFYWQAFYKKRSVE